MEAIKKHENWLRTFPEKQYRPIENIPYCVRLGKDVIISRSGRCLTHNNKPLCDGCFYMKCRCGGKFHLEDSGGEPYFRCDKCGKKLGNEI